ncbi:endoplasmic reticulum metallopeptidase 1-like isoform X1 [Halichondria panicea]|uniref:endoplasmic reticulum metallopeptidase 1-like isoform X1 n=1 Tax=Halichondria panicea TaxID=6063 RepID=UPI00312B9ADC
MKSSIRQRSGVSAASNGKHRRKVSWNPDIPINQQAASVTSLEDPLLSGPLVFLYVLLLSLLCAGSLYLYTYLPNPIAKGQPNDFLAANSRAHMEDIVRLGIRHVGSEANEVHTKALLLKKIDELKTTASDKVKIEVSVQEVSGSFYIDFLGGMTHIYQNISNIAVRLSRKSSKEPEHSFLINSHYDSALGTVGASDDAVSCGTMLEVIRCLSTEPHPLSGDNSLIFLFNGAEEVILVASHGFITQHPWAKQIRAFLNLDAAGAGGKEIVFQTGPNHPWLARLYARVVPHPHASVVAQEVFQSGVIPSDTDFRIFRDYGHVPGIDTAYFINGYVYHTEYDVPSAIPDGSIQRAGENVIAILREVATSEQLANPSEEDTNGKVVFFDIMGLMTVVYPYRMGRVLNITMVIIILLSVWLGTGSNGDKVKPSLWFVVKTMIVMVISWLAAIVMAIMIALFLSKLGRGMSWFAYPLVTLPLYGVSAVLAIGETNVQWMKWNRGMPRVAMEKASFLAAQLLTSFLLLSMTALGLCSALLPLILLIIPFIFRTFLLETLIVSELTKGRDLSLYGLAYTLCCLLSTGLPLMLTVQLDMAVMSMFIPLTGRMGSEVPPDLVIGVATAVLACLHSPHTLCVVIFASSASLKRWSGVVLLAIFSLFLFLAATGYIPPYSLSDPSHPRPKRLYLQHTDKTLYNLDGSVNATNSFVLIYPFDYLGLTPVIEVTPMFREATLYPCEGIYCSEPIYIPVKHMAKEAYQLPGPPLDHLVMGKLSVVSVSSHGDRRNTTFSAKFPLRGTMYMAPVKGRIMTSWSLEAFVPPTTTCPGSYEKEGCYFIFLSRGFGEGEFTFWIETEGDPAMAETIEIAYTSQNLDPPLSHTPRLHELQSSLPEWVTCISWTSKYLRWIF